MPGIFSSGKFTATNTRITKRGSKRLRRSLYLAVQCVCGKTRMQEFVRIMRKKEKRASPTKLKPYLTKTSIDVEVIRVGRKKYITKRELIQPEMLDKH
jgi:hypothetical protein